jgi:hypothetical protein
MYYFMALAHGEYRSKTLIVQRLPFIGSTAKPEVKEQQTSSAIKPV